MDVIDITKTYSGDNTPEVVTQKLRGKTFRYVPYNIVKTDDVYTWNYVLVGPANYNYEGLIDSIIGIKYDLRAMLAILNNYLLEPKNKEYKQEFDDMQAWRLKAKQYAKEHFNK